MAKSTTYVMVSMTLLEAKSYHMAASNNIDSVSFEEIVDAVGSKKEAQAAIRGHRNLGDAIRRVEQAQAKKAVG